MQPGDVVSMYATAKDARNTAQTDILFVEAQAYERNYTQSQQAGGGGGGGGGGGQQAQEIWDRQKQVITATYNATRPNDKTRTRGDCGLSGRHRADAEGSGRIAVAAHEQPRAGWNRRGGVPDHHQ